jgi:hypothetical protein
MTVTGNTTASALTMYCSAAVPQLAVGLFLAWWMSGQMKPFFKKRSGT